MHVYAVMHAHAFLAMACPTGALVGARIAAASCQVKHRSGLVPQHALQRLAWTEGGVSCFGVAMMPHMPQGIDVHPS